MTRMVQLVLAGDVTEAEELQDLLRAAGIDSTIDTAGEDDPLTVSVAEDELEQAQEAIEALSEPDDLLAEP